MNLVAPQALLLLLPLGLFLYFTARIAGPPMWLRVALVALLVVALARPEFRLRSAGSDVVVIIESMKMEIPVITEDPGTVKEILVKEKDPVAEGQVVAVLDG